MAESFFKFQDTKEKHRTSSSPSRNFKDFEEEWLQLGEDFSIVFDSGNSPKDPHQTPKKESKKRKISETEDSLIITSRKMMKPNNGRFTQQKSEEDPILKTFRQENPEKFKAREKRTRCTFTLDSSVPRYTPASPGFSGASQGIDFLPSPDHNSTPHQATFAHSTASSGRAQVVPTYSPASPGFIDFLPSPGHTLTPHQATFAHTTASSGCAQVTSTYSETCEDAQYPLQKELGALSELVDSLRVDLLQTSMLVNYVQDYIQKWK